MTFKRLSARIASVILSASLLTSSVTPYAYAAEPATEETVAVQMDDGAEAVKDSLPEASAGDKETKAEADLPEGLPPLLSAGNTDTGLAQAADDPAPAQNTEAGDASGDQGLQAQADMEVPEDEEEGFEYITEDVVHEAVTYNADTSLAENEIEMKYSGIEDSYILDAYMDMADFAKQLMAIADIEVDDFTSIKCDYIEDDGYRSLLDFEDDEYNKLANVYVTIAGYEDDHEAVIVFYTDDEEIARFRITCPEDKVQYMDVKHLTDVPVYEVVFDPNGGTLIGPQKIIRGKGDKLSNLNDMFASKENRTFIGWYSDSEDFTDENTCDEDTVVTGNMTLYAGYTANNTYRINFDYCDGDPSTKTSRTVESSLSEININLPNAQRTGYTFCGWYSDKAGGVKCTGRIRIEDTEDGEITLYAHWQEGYTPTVTYVYYPFLDRWSDSYFEQSYISSKVGYDLDGNKIDFGETDDLKDRNPKLLGWSDTADGTISYQAGDRIEKTTTLYGHWSFPADLTFDPGFEGAIDKDKEKAEVYTGVSLSEFFRDGLPVPSCDNHEFVGWFYNDGEGPVRLKDKLTSYPEFPDTDPVVSITLTAVWDEKEVHVTFDPNAEKGKFEDPDEATRIVVAGKKIGVLPTVSNEDSIFDGWWTAKTGGMQISKTQIVTDEAENVTYYAHWKLPVYTVTFDPEDGTISGNRTVKVTKGGKVADKDIPEATRINYTFAGWTYVNEDGETEEFTSDTVIRKDMTVSASWKAPTCIVTFDPNDEGKENPIKKTETEVKLNATGKGAIGTIPDLSDMKKDWIFLGWFDDKEGGNKYTSSSMVSEDITLYAHWEKKVYKVLVSKITLNKEHVTINMGEDPGLEFTYEPADAENATFYWTSSNPLVISITENGGLKVVGAGETTLAVYTTDNTVRAICRVTVNKVNKYLDYLAFNKDHMSLTYGDEFSLSYSYGPSNADNAVFKWSSNNPDVIRVSEDGEDISYGGSEGEATITIEPTTQDPNHKLKATCTIVVNKKEDQKIPEETFRRKISFETNCEQKIDSMISEGESIILPKLRRDGYQFAGWYHANGTKAGDAGNGYLPAHDVTLYAHWIREHSTKNTYTIRYDKCNGEEPEKRTYEEGTNIGELPKVERTGYTFMGWYTDVYGGKKLTGAEIVERDMTVYAQWLANRDGMKYDLCIDPAGGYINSKPDVVIPDKKLQHMTTTLNDISEYMPQRNGFVFVGWFDSVDPVQGKLVYDEFGSYAPGSRYWDTDGNYKGDGRLTVYARWKKDVKSYKLSFDRRSPGVVIPDVVKYENETIKISDVIKEDPTYEGFVFMGWYTHPTAGEKVTSVTMTSDITLYARWEKEPEEPEEPKDCTISFNTMGGSEVEDLVAKEGEIVDLSSIETVREGYIFLDWFTEDATRILGNLKVTDDMTLYAGWKKEDEKKTVYKVSFDDCNGHVETHNVVKDEYITDFAMPQRTGYIFRGWYTAAEGGAYVTSYTATGDITFYAHWDEIITSTWKITFDAQGGSSVEPKEVVHGTRVPSTEFPVTSRPGYTFKGWYTAAQDGKKVSAVTVNSDVTLYAHWDEDVAPDESYKIIFDNQIGGKEERVAKAGTAFTDFPKAERMGYDFLGWATTKNGTKNVVSYTGKVGETVTFYAIWREVTEEQKVLELKLNYHSLTVKVGATMGLRYTYSPDTVDKNQFVWSSSNPSVIATDGKTFQYSGKTGKVVLTISSKDGSKSDSCTVTVVAQDKAGKTNGVFKGVTNGGSGGGSSSSGSGSGSAGGSAAGGTGDDILDAGEDGIPAAGSSDGTDNGTAGEVVRYEITLIGTDQSEKEINIKTEVALSALVARLGYEADRFTLKRAGSTEETDIDADITMKELAEMTRAGEILVIAYAADGSLVGAGKVTRNSESSYTLTLTQDLDIPLAVAEYVPEEPAKGESVKDVKTGDNLNVYLLAGIAVAVIILVIIGFVLISSDIKKKKKQ